jgi:hypothetical protein
MPVDKYFGRNIFDFFTDVGGKQGALSAAVAACLLFRIKVVFDDFSGKVDRYRFAALFAFPPYHNRHYLRFFGDGSPFRGCAQLIGFFPKSITQKALAPAIP